MIDSQLNKIETDLGIILPSQYRDAALSGEFKDPIHDDPESIISINREFRDGIYGDENWPSTLFAFGHDGAGNYFCIDTNSADATVYLRDHEILEIMLESPSFSAWLHEWKSANQRSAVGIVGVPKPRWSRFLRIRPFTWFLLLLGATGAALIIYISENVN